MVTVRQAKSLLVNNVDTLETISKELIEAMGYVMVEDIFSPIDLPPFTSSAMDGYAVHSSDIRNKPPFKLKIKGEMRAGDFKRINAAKGEAVRIFTGAPLPSGSDCVVIQEQTQQNGDFILIEKIVGKHENIRFKGEEIKKSQKVLSKGTVINPAVIGLLSIMGIDEVRVIRAPKVYAIVTGNELVRPGIPLRPGQVYDSNSFSIHSALKKTGVDKIKVLRKGDSLRAIRKAFERGVSESDAIIFSGGISVGKYDSVRELFKKVGVETIFYKVEQKPGKPIYFGSYNRKLIFGLPGNPVSSLVCFYEYVYPALRKMMGHYPIFLQEKNLVLLKEISTKGGKVNFLRGRAYNDKVIPLKFQDSHMLSTFAKANCLIVVPKNKKLLKKGEQVRVQILPV
jgi:molybdopterin molybdotransferase